MGSASAGDTRLSLGWKLKLAFLRRMASLRIFRPPAGSYYSPIPSLKEVRRDGDRIFDRSCRDLPGVDLDAAGQLRLLDRLAEFYPEQPFSGASDSGRRYSLANLYFGQSDAIFLYAMIRLARPRRIIEIGSGYSSFVMLDTNELFFENRIGLTFIEPDARRLRSRLRPVDLETASILEKRVQDVDIGVFRELAEGDILFVDSSHVSKAGSDVNHVLFEILPSLARGVLIQFHDVHYPFEYPRDCIENGVAWNEAYLLRAFLQYNSAFGIRLWTRYLMTCHADRLNARMPLCGVPDPFGVGGSLWLHRA